MKSLVIANDNLLYERAIIAMFNIRNTDSCSFIDELKSNSQWRQDQHALVCLANHVFGDHNLHQRLTETGISKHSDTTFADCLGDDVRLEVESRIRDPNWLKAKIPSAVLL